MEKANYSITRMTRLLQVARAGFYAWRKRRRLGPGPQASRREQIDAAVRAAFTASGEVYGAPRIQAELAAQGLPVNVKTVAASMRRQGLEGISPRKWRPVTTIPGASRHAVPDRVEREWDWGELNAVWISDITYLRTGEGWLYLCAVRDACSRRVIGWAMDEAQTTELVERALRMAYTLRGQVPDGVVFHADRGTQFMSGQLYDVCVELGVRQSAGRTGVCWDHAMAESFWSTLKTEFYDRRRWETRAEARKGVAEWIERVYNRGRRHSSLGYETPAAFEEMFMADGRMPLAA